MTVQDNKTFTLKCSCNDIGLHDVKFQVSFDEKFGDDVCIYTSMCHYIPWYKRLYNAAKYVLGIDNTFVDYVETMVDSKTFVDTMDEICNYIEEYSIGEKENTDDPAHNPSM